MNRSRLFLCVWALAAFPAPIWSQSDAGAISGILTDATGRALAAREVQATGVPSALVRSGLTDSAGQFTWRVPYGSYQLTAGNQTQTVTVRPLQTVCVRVVAESRISLVPCSGVDGDSFWSLPAWRAALPEFNGLDALLLALEPATVTQPLNLTGPVSTPRSLISHRAFSWSSVRYQFHGVNATDPYQPGRPGILPDPSAIGEVAIQTGFDAPEPALYGSTISLFQRTIPEKWRYALASSFTGAALAADNLPDPVTRGMVKQSEHYRWFTRDHVETGGPLGRRLSLLLSATGQWASQTVPVALPGSNLNTRLLTGAARFIFQMTPADRLEADFHGSRTAGSDWGQPAGTEALIARRGGPSWSAATDGFSGAPENDRFYNLAGSWTRTTTHGAGLQARFGLSDIRIETPSPAPGAQSRVDLLGESNGVPPLSGDGDRRIIQLAAGYSPARLNFARSRHQLTAGGEWETAGIHNRIAAPGGVNLLTAAGVPTFVLTLNTPLRSQARTHHIRGWARDEIALAPWLKATLSAGLDHAAGSVPESNSAAVITPGGPVSYGGKLISWTTLSRGVAIAATPGNLQRLVFRVGYARVYAPLAGRYLDYGDPGSLGGVQSLWRDANGDNLYQTGEMGQAVLAFGGPYSRIDPGLRRPYADEVNVAAEGALPFGLSARLWLFRREDKARLAAVNTGVPGSAFTPAQILDAGPDGIAGTFDDAPLTVYAQAAATLGADRYLLTNPTGLKTLGEGMIAELSGRWGQWQFHSSFMAVKSEGATNPGNLPLQNDPGIVGSLLGDPNAAVNASGRAFFDRAYVGKTQFLGVLPKFLARLEWANTVTYMDGLPFARLLLITGFPQGPFWVNASVHGSPGGGNRAEYVLNWNMRLAKTVRLSGRTLRWGADVFNAAGFGNRIQEIDVSGPNFNQRLPVAIQPAPSVRFFLEFGS